MSCSLVFVGIFRSLDFFGQYTFSMPSPYCSTIIRGAQGWILTTRSLITATNIIASIGSSTLDLRLGHKTYYRVDFQPIYTMPPESSSSDPPHASQRFGNLFHAFHMPLVLLQSSHCHRYLNRLSSIYIIGKESASSNCLCILTHR